MSERDLPLLWNIPGMSAQGLEVRFSPLFLSQNGSRCKKSFPQVFPQRGGIGVILDNKTEQAGQFR